MPIFPYIDSYDLLEMQKRRNILISDDIARDMAMRVMVLIREMDTDDSKTPIWLLINSKGGDVQAGWTIIDSMNLAKCPIHTVCYGEAASIAALIFANGKKGGRYMLEHSKLMIHQPWTFPPNSIVKQTDLAVLSEDMSDTRNEIEEFLARVSGNTVSTVHELCENDFRMDARKAISLGFADVIMH